jgi:Right handed beta helix region
MHLFRSGVLTLLLIQLLASPSARVLGRTLTTQRSVLAHDEVSAFMRSVQPTVVPTATDTSVSTLLLSPVWDRAATTPTLPVSTPAPTSNALPQMLPVTTTADVAPCAAGPGKPGFSLRCAMGLGNRIGPGHSITFAIPASDPGCRPTQIGTHTVSVCTVELTRVLTLSASSTTIDGYTQPGASPNTSSDIGSRDNAVITIQLDGAQSFGGAIAVSSANDDAIRGLSITNFHTGPALNVSTADRFSLTGNFIGVSPDGSAQGNGGGVALSSIHTALLGGNAPADRNLIQNNAGNGISVSQYADGVTVRGNVIADNGRSGIQLGAYGPGSIPAVIQQNTIFNNKTLGIDVFPLDSHNCSILLHTTVTFTPCPIIHTATTQVVRGTACNTCTVEVFVATGEADDRGFGEGKTYLGQAVARRSTWSLKLHSGRFNPQRQQVTATATSSGSLAATSEFSLNLPVRFHIRSVKSGYGTVRGRVTTIKVTWRMSNQMGVAGFNLLIGTHRLNHSLIHVDSTANYTFAARLSGRPTNKVMLAVVFENGNQAKVRLRPKG